MPNFTPKLNLEKPLQSEFYNVDVFNGNSDKIDTAMNNTDILLNTLNDDYQLIKPKILTKNIEVTNIFLNGTTGNDLNDGKTSSTAFKTWVKVEEFLEGTYLSEDVVVNIANGTYNETMSLNGVNGTATITINGNASIFFNVDFRRINIPLAINGVEVSSIANDFGFFFSYCRNSVLTNCSDARITQKTGLGATFSQIKAQSCIFSDKLNGILASDLSQVLSINNVGDRNTNGLLATGSIIFKDGQQPNGTTNEVMISGGLIR